MTNHIGDVSFFPHKTSAQILTLISSSPSTKALFSIRLISLVASKNTLFFFFLNLRSSNSRRADGFRQHLTDFNKCLSNSDDVVYLLEWVHRRASAQCDWRGEMCRCCCCCGAFRSSGVQLGRARAASEAGGPQGWGGQVGLHLGCIWTSSCP